MIQRDSLVTATRPQLVGYAWDLDHSADAAIQAMATYVLSRSEQGARVGVGDAELGEVAAGLSQELRKSGEVIEVVRYQVGPSVAAHTGVGTVGAVFF